MKTSSFDDFTVTYRKPHTFSYQKEMQAAALGPKLAPFTPSGDGVLEHALDLLALTDDDVLFDLGCGDARILVHAAEQTGARCCDGATQLVGSRID
jgi:hypothetical protein